MIVIVTYDISEDRVRTRLMKDLRDFGPRVQYSVFETDINEKEFEKLNMMLAKVDLGEQDSIRLYQICRHCEGKIKLWGQGEVSKDKPYYIG
jgi:CRISPR-associated protein Cas2